MSKKMRFTPDIIDEIRKEFEKVLETAKLIDGKINFTKTLPSGNDRATLVFESAAYLKMMELVRAFDKEVAWHFCVDRTENENEYRISDVIVYPQSVSAATVDTDKTAYNKWLNDNLMQQDERFFHMRGQGHSHVNMGTSPSTTDMEHQRKVVNDMRQSDFYVFVIWNKKNEHTVWIYDMEKNTVFENKDITIKIDGFDLADMSKFLSDARSLVKTTTYLNNYYQNGSYNTSLYSTPATKSPAVVIPIQKTQEPAKPKDTAPAKKQDAKKEKVRAKPYGSFKSNAWSYYDDEDDPTSPFYVNDHYYGLE